MINSHPRASHSVRFPSKIFPNTSSNVGYWVHIEIPCSALPRFQHVNKISGCTSTSLQPSFVREYTLTVPHPSTGQPLHTGYLLIADDTSWISKFNSGTLIELHGCLTVHLVLVRGNYRGSSSASASAGRDRDDLRLESLEFDSRGHSEFIQREALVDQEEKTRKASLAASNGSTTSTATTQETKESPTKRKPAPKRGVSTRRRTQTQEEDESISVAQEVKGSVEDPTMSFTIPVSPVGSFGITEMGMRCLEVRYFAIALTLYLWPNAQCGIDFCE
jgi:hypothetical protein